MAHLGLLEMSGEGWLGENLVRMGNGWTAGFSSWLLVHRTPRFQCRATPLITVPANLMDFLFLILCHYTGRRDLAVDFALSKPQIYKTCPSVCSYSVLDLSPPTNCQLHSHGNCVTNVSWHQQDIYKESSDSEIASTSFASCQ